MELFDTQALLCLVSITDHLKSYTWQSTTVTQWGEGNRLDYIKRPCLKGKKKKRSKTNCFKTFKTSRHFLCKGMDSEMGRHSAQEATFLPCTPQHLPHPTQTNPIPSAQALRWKQRSPSVEHGYRKRTMEKGPQRPRHETEDSPAVLPCSQSGLGLINLFLG